MQKDVVSNIDDSSTSLLMSVFKTEKTIDSQLPIIFKSGYKLEEFNTKCHCCSAHLKGNQFKGSIFKVAKNSRFECWSVDKIDDKKTENSDLEKVMIDAVGFCPQCSVYTPCQVHVEDKGLSQEEAQAREEMIEAKRKEKRSKSFFGLTLQKMDSVKSQRPRNIETTKLNKVAKGSVSNVLINSDETAESIKQKSFVKQSSTVKTSLVQARVEEIIAKDNSNIGKLEENITDMNVIARHNLTEDTRKGSKSVDAYKVASALTDPLSTLHKNSNNSREGVKSRLNTVSEPKLGFLSSQNIKITESLVENDTTKDSVITLPTIALTRKFREDMEQKNNIAGDNDDLKHESFEDIRNGASVLLRGSKKVDNEKHEPYLSDIAEETVLVRRDSRGIKGSSTSSAAKIESRTNYVQSSGSFVQKLSEFFSTVYRVIKSSNKNRKNDILKSYKYKADKNHGRESARNRLESLRENQEFERKNSIKNKTKKHNHDSFH